MTRIGVGIWAVAVFWAALACANVEDLRRSASGLADARAKTIATFSSDNVMETRLFIISDPALRAAAHWDDSGERIFPPTAAVLTPAEDAAETHLTALALLYSGTQDSPWALNTANPEVAYYCNYALLTCLVLDVAALAEELPAQADALYAALHTPITPDLSFWPILSVFAAIAFVAALATLPRLAGFPRQSTPKPTAQTGVPDPDTFDISDITVSPRRLMASKGGNRVDLSPRDVALLDHLHRHRGQVCSRDALYDAGWGRQFMPNSRALDQHMITLRRKLKTSNIATDLIETVRGAGYRLKD